MKRIARPARRTLVARMLRDFERHQARLPAAAYRQDKYQHYGAFVRCKILAQLADQMPPGPRREAMLADLSRSAREALELRQKALGTLPV